MSNGFLYSVVRFVNVFFRTSFHAIPMGGSSRNVMVHRALRVLLFRRLSNRHYCYVKLQLARYF